jgi:hypothetical protein
MWGRGKESESLLLYPLSYEGSGNLNSLRGQCIGRRDQNSSLSTRSFTQVSWLVGYRHRLLLWLVQTTVRGPFAIRAATQKVFAR